MSCSTIVGIPYQKVSSGMLGPCVGYVQSLKLGNFTSPSSFLQHCPRPNSLRMWHFEAFCLSVQPSQLPTTISISVLGMRFIAVWRPSWNSLFMLLSGGRLRALIISTVKVNGLNIPITALDDTDFSGAERNWQGDLGLLAVLIVLAFVGQLTNVSDSCSLRISGAATLALADFE